MPKQATLVLIKPHAVATAGWVSGIFNRYKDAGFKVEDVNVFTFTHELAKKFYTEHYGKSFFPGLIQAMCEGPTVALILEAEDAIKRIRTFNGATNPADALPGTIRADFRGSGGPYNTVHGSDNGDAVGREIRLIFPPT